MKTKIFIWPIVVILMLIVVIACLFMPDDRFRIYFVELLVRLLPMLFWGCILAIHIALGWFIWRDAGHRDDLLIGISAWVWALIGLTGGVLGLIIYWSANCSQLVRRNTGIGDSKTQPPSSPDSE